MFEENDLIQIGSFTDSFQANFAKDILLSNDITCRVVGDAFSMIDLIPIKPISLQINVKDLLKAQSLLEIYFTVIS